jgi:hypothetical protein
MDLVIEQTERIVPGGRMSYTRGGPNKRRQFDWHYDPESGELLIINQNGREIMYSVGEIQGILLSLQARFGKEYFRLSNNVAFLGDKTEQEGLGMTILGVLPGDFTRAQGASYLGVVLEECGYLEWNGKSTGIAWRVVREDFGSEALKKRLRG